MTRNAAKKATTRRTTAKKAAAPAKGEKGAPMDPSVREQATPDPISRNERTCYAALTLIEEVESLFPETTHEVSNKDPFNVNLDVMFETHESPDLYALLSLVEADERVAMVQGDRHGDEEAVLVSFHMRATLKDSREPFGLAEAHAVLTEQAEAADPGFVVEDDEDEDEDETEALRAEAVERLAEGMDLPNSVTEVPQPNTTVVTE